MMPLARRVRSRSFQIRARWRNFDGTAYLNGYAVLSKSKHFAKLGLFGHNFILEEKMGRKF